MGDKNSSGRKQDITVKDRIGMLFSGANVTLFLLVSAYLTYFYTDVIGLDAGIVGVVILISKVFDGISDLILGNIMDKTRTKKGVFRPWVLRIAPWFGVGIIMLFTVPRMGTAAQVVYLFIVYNVSQTLIYTISSLAVQSLPTYITREAKPQTELYAWNNIGLGVLSTLISGFTFKLVGNFGNNQKAWIITAVIYAVIAVIALLLTGTLCEEKINPDELVKEEKVSFGKGFKAILQNKYWFYVLGLVVFGTAVYTTSMQMHTYYSQYVLGDINYASALNSAYAATTLILGVLFIPIVRYLSAKKIVLVGLVIQTLGCVVIALAPMNITMLTFGTVLKGIGHSCCGGMFLALLAATIEYGQWKTGVRSQAMIVGANGAGQKIGTGLVTGFLGIAMSLTGYDGTLAVQSESAMSGISVLFLYIPLILTVLELLCIWRYDLDKKYDSILKELQERNGVPDAQ